MRKRTTETDAARSGHPILVVAHLPLKKHHPDLFIQGFTAIKNGQSCGLNATDRKNLIPQNERATANLVWLRSEDQKIIHAVGFHEIL